MPILMISYPNLSVVIKLRNFFYCFVKHPVTISGRAVGKLRVGIGGIDFLLYNLKLIVYYLL